MNLFFIFITGLTTGGITCAAMQGGLLISAITNRKDKFSQSNETDVTVSTPGIDKSDYVAVVSFISAKLIAYTFVGFLLGAIGGVITLNLTFRVLLQLFTVFYMFATAMNLLNVHPIFRYVVITPPKFIQKKIRSTAKSQALFAPAILGFFTIFIPCGVTQAMEVLAISSGNALTGALIMFSFVLGTIPLFTLIGLATAKFTHLWRERFLHFAAILLIFMSLYYLNGILQVLDAPISVKKIVTLYNTVNQIENSSFPGVIASEQVEGVQKATIMIQPSGYTPSYIRVKQGIPVELTVSTNNVYSCATAFTLKAFKIFKQFQPTESATFTFTPQKPGKFTYSCSMGMYTGTLEVI